MDDLMINICNVGGGGGGGGNALPPPSSLATATLTRKKRGKLQRKLQFLEKKGLIEKGEKKNLSQLQSPSNSSQRSHQSPSNSIQRSKLSPSNSSQRQKQNVDFNFNSTPQNNTQQPSQSTMLQNGTAVKVEPAQVPEPSSPQGSAGFQKPSQSCMRPKLTVTVFNKKKKKKSREEEKEQKQTAAVKASKSSNMAAGSTSTSASSSTSSSIFSSFSSSSSLSTSSHFSACSRFKPPAGGSSSGSHHKWTNKVGNPSKMVAIDCEMVGTGPKGSVSQLARCSVVSYDGDVVYDQFIVPPDPVTDYRTRWSGIRRQDLRNAKPYAEARKEILRLLMGKVVIGHAIHNDFKVLGYSHPGVLTRDTSRIPLLNMRAGLPEKEVASLKRLTKAIFNKDIQEGRRGHSSVEDAKATMELYKVVEEEWERTLSANSHA